MKMTKMPQYYKNLLNAIGEYVTILTREGQNKKAYFWIERMKELLEDIHE